MGRFQRKRDLPRNAQGFVQRVSLARDLPAPEPQGLSPKTNSAPFTKKGSRSALAALAPNTPADTYGVDEFVDAKAPRFNRVQQGPEANSQTVQFKPTTFSKFQQVSTNVFHLVRDQEAGGSNPLAPTFGSV